MWDYQICKFKRSRGKVGTKPWVLSRPFQCKYVETLRNITYTSNAMYTLSKCNRPKDFSNKMKINYKSKTLYPILSVHLILIFVTLKVYSILCQVHLLLKLYKIACYQLKMQEKSLKNYLKRELQKIRMQNFFLQSRSVCWRILSTVVKKKPVRKGDKEKQISAKK